MTTRHRVAFVLSNQAVSSVTGRPIRSGNLITGQQQHSGGEAARLAIVVLA